MKKGIFFLIHGCIILITASLFCLYRNIFSAGDAREVFRILTDAFSIPAVIYIGISLLSLAASKGTYDMLRFAFGSVFSRFLPGMDRNRYESFYVYRAELLAKERSWTPRLLYMGLIALGMSVLFLIFYYIV